MSHWFFPSEFIRLVGLMSAASPLPEPELSEPMLDTAREPSLELRCLCRYTRPLRFSVGALCFSSHTFSLKARLIWLASFQSLPFAPHAVHSFFKHVGHFIGRFHSLPYLGV